MRSLKVEYYGLNYNHPPKDSPLPSLYNASGCASPLMGQPALDDQWPARCVFTKAIRSLIVGGPDGRLHKEKFWLRRFDSMSYVMKPRLGNGRITGPESCQLAFFRND